MLRSEKQATIDEVRQRFDRMSSAVLVDYQRITVANVTRLRDEMRKAGVEYLVVKNTLIRRAIEHLPWATNLGGALRGMTAVAWCYEDPSAAAKVLKAFSKDHDQPKVKAGVIDGQVLDGEGVLTKLATMPGKNELRARLLATLQAPMQKFLQQLSAPAQTFMYLLKARQDQIEKGS